MLNKSLDLCIIFSRESFFRFVSCRYKAKENGDQVFYVDMLFLDTSSPRLLRGMLTHVYFTISDFSLEAHK